jgi:hypothetical protein
MGLLNNQLRRFDKPQCFFYQNNKCNVGKKHCINCSLKVEQIDGMDNVKDYLSFVTARNLNNKNFWFAFMAFVLSFLTLLLNISEVLVNKPKQ